MDQGRKQVIIGAQMYVYDPSKYLIISVDLPVSGQVIEASPGGRISVFGSTSIRRCWER